MSSRKRSRSTEDDCDDCVPISKRIHKLQIRSRGCSSEDENVDGGQINNNIQAQSVSGCHGGWQEQSNEWNSGAGTSSNPGPSPGTVLPSVSRESNGLQGAINGLQGQMNGLHGQVNGLHGQVNGIHGQVNGLGQTNGINGTLHKQFDVRNYDQFIPYDPGMEPSDNPHYYHINELLYHAHVARSNRPTSRSPQQL